MITDKEFWIILIVLISLIILTVSQIVTTIRLANLRAEISHPTESDQ